MSLIDITRSLCPGMRAYSPEEGFVRDQVRCVAQDGYALSYLHLGAHCGTHMDAPAHFLAGGQTIDQVPLDLLVGEALVWRTDISPFPQCERLLLKSSGNFAGLDERQARALADSGVRLVGTEHLSIAPANMEARIHRILFRAGVWVVENLDLSQVSEGRYRLYCLPLKIDACEGAPARALLEAP